MTPAFAPAADSTVGWNESWGVMLQIELRSPMQAAVADGEPFSDRNRAVSR